MRGTAQVEVRGDTAWWVARTLPHAGTLENGVFETDYATSALLASWVLRQNGRAIPLEPERLRRDVTAGLAQIRKRHEGRRPRVAEEEPAEVDDAAAERAAGPVAPGGVLQALLAHLLAACGDGREATLDAHELADRFSIPFDQLDEHLSLLNLVNFGGGCYTVYAELRGDRVHVDKELFGDVFRRPPRLTPLEARAIRLALEFVGPMIAAGSRSALDNVRHKLEETFGQFELVQTAEPQVEEHEEELVRILSEAIEAHRVVTIEYLKEGEAARATSSRMPSSASCRSGACIRGTATSTSRGRTGSTACARPDC